jgi:uncharacterized membrane protein
MRLWLIPLGYAIGAMVLGLAMPRIEHAFFLSYAPFSVSSTQAFLSTVASGMMALTGIVFSVAFVMVQFSAIAYSPRLVMWFARDPRLFHSLGIFIATFLYSLWQLTWVDRHDSGKVPLVSVLVVAVLLVFSTIAFARLIQHISDLQISNVLATIGRRGRAVIMDMFRRLDAEPRAGAPVAAPPAGQLGPVTQIVAYRGEPRAIAELDVRRLVRNAQTYDAVFVMARAVGDTVFDGNALLEVHGARARIPDQQVLRGIKLLPERTFKQDPKYPLRLLVDIAIKALSPAINDPTTAVQAIDQIEDLLLRLGRRNLDDGCACSEDGKVRLTYPTPNWEDYLGLAFDEIRHYGMSSIQVMRRLRSTLVNLADSLADRERAASVRRYLEHLDLAVDRSPFDDGDRARARQEDRQGLGVTRRQ